MNKEEENERIEYNIPGVIIPAQKTDSGIIGGQNLSNTSVAPDVVSSNVVASSNGVVQNSTPPNGDINQVSINNNSQVASVISNVNQANANVLNVAGSNVNDVQSINQGDVGFSNNTTSGYVNNIGQQLQIQNIGVPSNSDVGNQTTIKNGKTKREKKNGNSSILIFIIVLLMAAIGYFVYNDYFAPKEEIDPVKELERKRSINVNSLLVQQLYSYVNLDGCGNQINFFYGSGAPVELKDLTDEQKIYLAYRQLLNRDIRKEYCSTYSKALHKNDKMGIWYCGEEYLNSKADNFNDENSITYIIDEDILKRQVEKMFGKGSYKATTFTIATSLRYLYDQSTSSYIYQTFYGGDSCKGYTNKLDSAYRKGNDVTIVVKVVNNEKKNITMFYYTFRESDDGNYYFSNLIKKGV